jgi:hypothetical protein
MQGGDSNTFMRRKKKQGLKEEHYWYVNSIAFKV